MIVPNEEAIDAAADAVRMMGISVPIPRTALGGIINAAIPHLTDAGQPLTHSEVDGGWLAERLDGLRAAITANHVQHNTGLASLGNRFDGLVDVMLRQENRINRREAEIYERYEQTGVPGPGESEAFPAHWDAQERERHRRHREVMARAASGAEQRTVVDVVEAFGTEHRASLSAIMNGVNDLRGMNPVTELAECVQGPTDYEVWRDALTLTQGDVGTRGWDSTEQMLTRALWWRDQLKQPIRDAPHSEHQPEPLIRACDPGDCDPNLRGPHEDGCEYSPVEVDDGGKPKNPPTSESGVSQSPDGRR
jgi:hypothetical protein